MKKLFFALVLLSNNIFSQNIGIGTTTPEGLLHVKGTNWTKAILENNTGEARGYIGADNNGTITIGANAYWNGTAWVYPNTGSSLYLLMHRLNHRYEFRVRPDGGSQSTAMTIDTGSNVTIGGNLVIDQQNGNTGSIGNSLRFGNFSGEGIGSKRNSGTGQYGLDFYTNSTNRMTVANNGNVGIGTITPLQKLSVSGGLVVDQDNTNNGSTAAVLSFGNTNSEGIGSKRNAGINQNGLDFYTNSINRMTITNAGFIGIGVNTPKSLLTIKHGGIVYDNTPPDGKHAIAIWDSSYNLSSVAMTMGTQNTRGVGYIGVERIGSNGVPAPKLVLNVHGAPVVIGGSPSTAAIPEKLLVMGHALVEGNLGTDMNLTVGQTLTVQNGAAITGNSLITGQVTVTGNIAGGGNAQLNGNLMVAGNRGIIRNSGTDQLKHVITTTQITRAAVIQNTFTLHTVNWSETFSSGPVTAYLADIPGGFGFEMLDLKIVSVSATGCTVVVSNSTQVPVPCDFTLKIVAIGPQ